MKNKSALIFIDGTICDDRHRVSLYGTMAFEFCKKYISDL